MKKHILFSFLASLCLLGGVSLELAPSDKAVQAADADDGKCTAALNLIDLNVDLTRIVSSFRLPYIGQYNSAITWTSSNPNAIAIGAKAADGAAGYLAKVTRADTAVSLTLSASASLTGSLSATRSFACTVLAANDATGSDLPLAMDEDFSEFATGIELANYFKWQSSNADSECAHAVESVSGNINDMVSAKALSLASVRTASDLGYTRTLNITTSEVTDRAVFEGYFLYSGDINGVALELLNGSGSPEMGFKIASDSYAYLQSGVYAKSTQKVPEEGVWQKFRCLFKPTTGRFVISLYDWLSANWVELTAGASTYLDGSGVSSGNKGDITGLRIDVLRGSKFGMAYLSNLKIDLLSNLPAETPTNPNRSVGLGTISNYDPIIFATTGTTPEGLNPAFKVYNRFDEATLLTLNTDYTLTSEKSENGDGSEQHRYTFTLLSTGETKTLSQYVYYTAENALASISDFKVSYVKQALNNLGVSIAGKGYITLSGLVNRGDGILYYAVLAKGASAPSAAELIAQNVPNAVTSGAVPLLSHAFSVNTANIAYTLEYDVYALSKNDNGVTPLYSASEISTIVNITSCQEFHDMSSDLTTLSSTFRLTQDLDFSSYYWEFDGTSRSFTGTLDGQGHSIKNLAITNSVSTTGVKTGIFFNLNGTVKNLSFANVHVTGATDVGILGGNAYGCSIENVAFHNCSSKLDGALNGGDGYFAIAIGRCRGGTNTFKNITIDQGVVEGPKYNGLLIAGSTASSQACTINIENILAQGSIKEDGACAGLIGRNQGATLTISNAVVFLDVLYAKKQVGGLVGQSTTGGSVSITNAVVDLRIGDMTQPTYMGQAIGYDDAATSNAVDYTLSNFNYLIEDYSAMGDSIVPLKNGITPNTGLEIPEEFTARWWESNTFLRDFDTSLFFAYDENSAKPVLRLRSAEEMSAQLTADMFTGWVKQIDLHDLLSSHYALYKAGDVYTYLSTAEKAKVSAETYAAYTSAKSAYETMLNDLKTIGGGYAL